MCIGAEKHRENFSKNYHLGYVTLTEEHWWTN